MQIVLVNRKIHIKSLSRCYVFILLLHVFMLSCLPLHLPPPPGKTLRLPSECHGQKVAWVLTSSPRTVHCPPLVPVLATEIPTTTTTNCCGTPSTPPQILPPSSRPQAAQRATGRLATGRPLPPTTATTTPAPCHAAPPSPSPRPMGTRGPCRSATASCRRPRCHRRSCRLCPLRHHCPLPPSQPPTSVAWGACPSWCLLRTKQALWCDDADLAFSPIRPPSRVGLAHCWGGWVKGNVSIYNDLRNAEEETCRHFLSVQHAATIQNNVYSLQILVLIFCFHYLCRLTGKLFSGPCSALLLNFLCFGVGGGLPVNVNFPSEVFRLQFQQQLNHS